MRMFLGVLGSIWISGVQYLLFSLWTDCSDSELLRVRVLLGARWCVSHKVMEPRRYKRAPSLPAELCCIHSAHIKHANNSPSMCHARSRIREAVISIGCIIVYSLYQHPYFLFTSPLNRRDNSEA
jgi:hypothetical protein